MATVRKGCFERLTTETTPVSVIARKGGWPTWRARRGRDSMYPSAERILATNKAATECLLVIGNVHMAAFERFVALTFHATRAMIESCLRNAEQGLGITGAQDQIDLNRVACWHSIEDAIAYLRSMYDVALQAHDELARVAEAQLANLDTRIAEELASAPLPAGYPSGMAAAAMKSAFAAAGSAYENLTRISTQTSRLADAGFSAALQGLRGAGRRKRRPVGALDRGTAGTRAQREHS